MLSRSTVPTGQERVLQPGTKNSGRDQAKHDTAVPFNLQQAQPELQAAQTSESTTRGFGFALRRVGVM
jgi:hypothetical protein